MTKRLAEYELNEKDIDAEPKERNPLEFKKSTEEEIAARRIVKIKRDEPAQESKDTPSKVKFNIAEPTTDDKCSDEKKEEKTSETKAPESIFGKFDMNNLFNNKPGEAGVNLFGKPVAPVPPQQATNFSSLFSNPVKTGETPSLLFSNNAVPTSNLFSNVKGLFGGLGGESKSFSQGSILNFGDNVPPMSRNDTAAGSEDEEGDDDEGAKPEHIDPSKSTGKYVYDCPFTKKIEKKLMKYRLNTNDIVDGVEVSIEELNENKQLYLIVRIVATKKILYQGQIIKKLAQIKQIASSSDSVEAKTFSFDEETKKPKMDCLRLKFESKEACDEFRKTFEEGSKE